MDLNTGKFSKLKRREESFSDKFLTFSSLLQSKEKCVSFSLNALLSSNDSLKHMSSAGKSGTEKKDKDKEKNNSTAHSVVVSLEQQREEEMKATTEATLTELREILKDTEQDTWQFVKPRTQL